MAQGRDVVPFARPTLPQFTLAFDRTNLHAKDARIGSRSSRWLSSSLALSAWTKLASRSASPHTGMARATTRRSLLDSASDLRMDAQRSSLHGKTNVANRAHLFGSSLKALPLKRTKMVRRDPWRPWRTTPCSACSGNTGLTDGRVRDSSSGGL